MNHTQMLMFALITVPTTLTVVIGILFDSARVNEVNSRLAELRAHMDVRFNEVDRRFDDIARHFDEMKEVRFSEPR